MRTRVSVLFFLITCLVACLCIPARAQEAKPETYAGFEGKKVSKVEISVKPTMDSAAFRPLLKIKAGDSFSSAAVQESVKALEQTKEFSKVQVSVEPEQAGLSVLFILEPASYVGIITFPGIQREFVYTRLLQAVDIPEQSPYFDDLLPQGQKALVKFLQVEGYFSAEVQPSTQRDDPHKIVNLVFNVELGPRARVGNINLDGVPADEAGRIRKDLHSIWARVKRDSLKPGQRYSPEKITKAAGYIRAHLRDENRLAPVVRHASSEYDPRTNRVDVTFQIDPGPLVSVRVTGAHLSKRAMRRQIPIYEESAVDRDLVDEGERNLVSYFESKGYFDVKVTTQYDQQPGRVAVTYQVDEGARHRVQAVYFEGNHYFNDRRMAAVVAIKKGHTFLGHAFSRGKFNDELLRKSVDSLTALYKNAGFAGVSVTSRMAEHNPQVDVTFQITEGEQDKVESFRLEGNRTQSEKNLSSKGALNLKPGKPYSPQLLEIDRNRILAAYLDAGYLNATFKSTVSPDPQNARLMNVVYTIEEGPQGHVSNVVVLGEKVTRPSLIQTITAPDVSPPKPLSEGKFFTAESNLYSLNIFDWVSIKPLRPVSDQDKEEVLVKVHESPRYSLDVGGGIEVIPRSSNIPVGEVALPGIPPIGLGTKFTVTQKSFFGPRFSFSIARHNMRGRARNGHVLDRPFAPGPKRLVHLRRSSFSRQHLEFALQPFGAAKHGQSALHRRTRWRIVPNREDAGCQAHEETDRPLQLSAHRSEQAAYSGSGPAAGSARAALHLFPRVSPRRPRQPARRPPRHLPDLRFRRNADGPGLERQFCALSRAECCVPSGASMADLGDQRSSRICRALFRQRCASKPAIFYGRRRFAARLSDQWRRPPTAGECLRQSK